MGWFDKKPREKVQCFSVGLRDAAKGATQDNVRSFVYYQPLLPDREQAGYSIMIGYTMIAGCGTSSQLKGRLCIKLETLKNSFRRLTFQKLIL